MRYFLIAVILLCIVSGFGFAVLASHYTWDKIYCYDDIAEIPIGKALLLQSDKEVTILESKSNTALVSYKFYGYYSDSGLYGIPSGTISYNYRLAGIFAGIGFIVLFCVLAFVGYLVLKLDKEV